jgi:hypothetical protein
VRSTCSIGSKWVSRVIDSVRSAGHHLNVPLDARMHHALTDLHAYALALDAERARYDDPDRTRIGEELDALRATIAALRRSAEPVEELV